MARNETLKAAITAAIKQNGNNEITGVLLQQQLLAMVNALGVGNQFAGFATPNLNPGTPDQNVFYIASTPGIYANFSQTEILFGEVGVFSWDGSWTINKINLLLGPFEYGDGPYSAQLMNSESIASGNNAVAEGNRTNASGDNSHSEGQETESLGTESHAEGSRTAANGNSSHAEGDNTSSVGNYSHSEGSGTIARGLAAHAEGINTESKNPGEHAEGHFNVSNTGSTDKDKTQHSVGIGTSEKRLNAFEIMKNGDAYLLGVGGYDGTNPANPGYSMPLQAILNGVFVPIEYINDGDSLDVLCPNELYDEAAGCGFMVTPGYSILPRMPITSLFDTIDLVGMRAMGFPSEFNSSEIIAVFGWTLGKNDSGQYVVDGYTLFVMWQIMDTQRRYISRIEL